MPIAAGRAAMVTWSEAISRKPRETNEIRLFSRSDSSRRSRKEEEVLDKETKVALIHFRPNGA